MSEKKSAYLGLPQSCAWLRGAWLLRSGLGTGSRYICWSDKLVVEIRSKTERIQRWCRKADVYYSRYVFYGVECYIHMYICIYRERGTGITRT